MFWGKTIENNGEKYEYIVQLMLKMKNNFILPEGSKLFGQPNIRFLIFKCMLT